MNSETKKIRQYLKTCSRKEFERLIYEGKLTPVEQQAIQYAILYSRTNEETADSMRCSGRTVSKVMKQAYMKIAKVTR